MAAGMRPSTFRLSDYFTPATIILALRSRSKPEVIRELLGTLELPAREELVILRTILRREEMGSTGIGRGIAVPHGRTPLVSKLRVVYGRSTGGIAYDSMDGAPVHHVFLLVAPPTETSNEYLPVLGRIAKLAQDPEIPTRLSAVESVEEFLRVLADEER
ncbi:MAG TPA: PTS sugar transporter subunit IIA [Gemmatimonadales bacterium]